MRYGRGAVVVGLVAIFGTGCGSRICCQSEDGTTLLDAAACTAASGLEVPRYVCKDPGDPDAGTDTEPGTDPSDETLPCEAFCDPMVALCPTDTLCLESCGHSTTPPSPSDIACVEAATDCAGAQPCWGFQTFAE